MPRYTSVEDQVGFGTNQIDPNRTIEISARDLLQVYLTLGELIRFFHQPMHYPTLEHVQRFLGTTDAGAFSILHRLYYHTLRDVWPEDIAKALDDGELSNPDPPYYYAANGADAE